MWIRLFVVLFLYLGLAYTHAQNPISQQNSFSTFNDYHLKISPFFWYLGLKGTVIAPPRPSNFPEPPPPRFDVDISFSDISNSLRFFMMLGTEYRGENFIVKANVTSLILEGEAVTPFEVLTKGVEYRFSYLTSEILAGYRIVKRKHINLNAMLGVRILATGISGSSDIINVRFDAERRVFWYDPILAIEFKYTPFPRVEFTAYTDFGPIRSINSYQQQLQATYRFTKMFATSLGYRNYFVDSENEDKDTIYTGRVFGPYIRFEFQF